VQLKSRFEVPSIRYEVWVLGGRTMSELYTLGLGFAMGIGVVVTIFSVARK
jgi:hypothetical protein